MTGPMTGPETLDRDPPRRRGAGVVVAAAVGLVTGAAAMSWWDDRQAPERIAAVADEPAASDVRLVLTGVRPEAGGLTIDAVLLHDRGDGSATVTGIGRPGGAIDVRSDDLPATLSVNRSFQRLGLRLEPKDCALATQWTPSSQPLVVTWQDDTGEVHEEVGGDHDADLEIAVIGYLDDVCATG